jgi:hypothetical protein
MKIIAKIITYITFPGLWAILGVYFMSRIDISNILEIQKLTQSKLLTASLLLYIIIPMLFVIFMVYKKRFESIQLASVKERKIAVPFALLSAMLMMFYSHELLNTKENLITYNKLLNLHPLFEWEQLVVLSLLVQTIFVFLNFKISIHMLSITAFTTFAFGEFNRIKNFVQGDCLVGENLYHWPNALLVPQNINLILTALVVLTALVFIARKILKAHTYQELIIGSIVGISITFVNSILLYTIWN